MAPLWPLSENRRRLYRALLSRPGQAWTVRELTTAVPTASAGAVRNVFYQLLALGLLRQVPHQRALTGTLTDEGRSTLTQMLNWGVSRKARPPCDQ